MSNNVYVSRFHPLSWWAILLIGCVYLPNPLRCCADCLLCVQFDITFDGELAGRIVFKLFDGTYATCEIEPDLRLPLFNLPRICLSSFGLHLLLRSRYHLTTFWS